MLSGPTQTVKRARRLRRVMSAPEVVLWQRLRLRPGGFKFRRQHPAGDFILDFFCSEARLAIEVDGFAHEAGNRPQADEMRNSWLRLRNVETLRISAAEVNRSPHQVIEWIVTKCEERVGPLHQPAAGPPPRSGEDS
jgi:very-short-patch-repair endonuclease